MEERKTNMVVVSISGMKREIEIVLDDIVDLYGKENVLSNFPRFDRRTGFWKVFVNLRNSCLEERGR